MDSIYNEDDFFDVQVSKFRTKLNIDYFQGKLSPTGNKHLASTYFALLQKKTTKITKIFLPEI